MAIQPLPTLADSIERGTLFSQRSPVCLPDRGDVETT